MSISKNLKRYRGWIAAVVLVAVAGTAYTVYRNSKSTTAATTYQTETVKLGTVSATVSGTGQVEAGNTTDASPSVSGTVAKVYVAKGSKVATGDVLFTLDATSANADTARALATLRQSQQSVAQAELQVAKAASSLAALKSRSSAPSSTVSSTDISVATAELTAARAGLASAKAQSSSSKISYNQSVTAEGNLTVTAPCSGVVYALNIAKGDTVAASSGSSSGSSSSASASSGSGSAGGATAGGSTSSSSSSSSSSAPVVIAPAQPLAVRLSVNEVDLPALKVGQRADISFDALPKVTATGKVYDIATSGTGSSGVVTFDVWVSIDVPDPALREGMSAAATIVTNVARDTLVVSNSAVQSDGSGGYFVQVMKSGSTTPTKVTVQTGIASATQTQILSGLTANDTVVTQTVNNTSTTTNTNSGFGSGGGLMRNVGGGPRG